jgi:hypothetical protein
MSPSRALLACAAIGLALAACDQASPRHPRIAPIPVPAVPPGTPADAVVPANPPRVRKGPVVWNPTAGAFELKGKALRAERLWTFDGSTDGFLSVGGDVLPDRTAGLLVRLAAPDAVLRSPRGLRVEGAIRPLILVRLTRTRAGGSWDGAVHYATTTHGESEQFLAKPAAGGDPGVNETVVLVYDMTQLRRGGDDWKDSIIDQIRLDLDDAKGGEFVIHQIAIAGNPDKVAFGPPQAAPAAPAPAPAK